MNALPKIQPITLPVLRRPSWRRYDLVRLNDRNAWIVHNMDLLLQYYRLTGDALRAAGEWTPPADPVAEFTVFCDIAFESEHAKFEEMKADGKYDDGREGPSD